MSKVIKPLLAKEADLEQVKFPVLATPKLDGIRCLMVDGEARSRNMKPIPNDFIREQLKGFDYLDGELMVDSHFNEVSSAVMSKDGEPNFTYYVFDTYHSPDESYKNRLEIVNESIGYGLYVRLLKPIELNSVAEVNEYLEECLFEGYEGIMLRDPEGVYKFGRSTVKEGILLKVKKWFNEEAILIDVEEQMTNTNVKERDELGRAKRSSAKAGKVPAGTAGACVIEWNGEQFNVGFGKGYTDKHKQEFWDNRMDLIGNTYTFKYQELSHLGIPRFGKLVGRRYEGDIS